MRQCYVDTETRAIVDVYNTHDNVYLVTRVNVPRAHRGRGIASRLMRAVIDDADTDGVVLELFVGPSDGLDFVQLEAWYKRLGFVQFTIPGHLHRFPRKER